ncbi:hypothetical protein HF888_10770 [Bermanella marisrubri]|uniref:2OG-Fe(II) oxygenase superfamily protein n=1 Tax=Bermanella marisrubri TaxID=207949 RepID=Q1N5M7_9GAMM|nr:alpha-ketoglutarate-dependent dioxygenase AlkB [Bermanella marisrubri]EAT13915.1 2OG-Fe(II) oxygenase superfamily protein [Oceanobacter sp. RED65] [Bermanella marisrubri]QIZ84669.1 hypothetical protein HF888_10770 [Bermanella marisrubri]
MSDLFASNEVEILDHGQGLFQIRNLVNTEATMAAIHEVAKQAPFRHMMTPMGHHMKVATTNCGEYGWIAQPSGYGYSRNDPESGQSWPAMPDTIRTISDDVIAHLNLPKYSPDACLINRYDIGTSMGRHQDKDEANFDYPIISVSLGLPAIFQVVGPKRQGKATYYSVSDGDVFILSGQARLYYHGVNTVKANPNQPELQQRYNLTLRRSQP